MRSTTPGSPYRSRKANPDQWSRSQSSAYSDTATVENPSPGTRRNPRKVVTGSFWSCFTPSGGFTSPRGGGEFDSQITLKTVASTGERRRANLYGPSNNSNHTQPGSSTFTIADIRKATRNFSPDYKIGQGGFGTVYRGRLQDGKFVAIKRGKKAAHEEHLSVEFHREVSTLACIEHLNLVRFMGYLEDADEKIVVVEYVSNGTLREHLDCMRGEPLDFAARLDIAIDVAHAITYLHMYADHPIIHRDVKSSNILLTENLRAKVADFGFARSGSTETGVTHVITQIKGTAGYLDPEYLRTYQLTEKSDVYSFGVLLVELMSGRRPIETKRELKERITARWVMKMYLNGKSKLVLDPNLIYNPVTDSALRKTLELALQCLAPTRQERPRMRRCAEILWNIRKDYKEIATSEILPSFPDSERNKLLMKAIEPC